ncbi:MAG: M15 family metallopeptidase [Oscillospiraceae bacterium]|jgi:D-alanyl-D-alanine carboxypeptidase|nr:M15 family metallopeptidase [Oscillospiraceae bacterium]
MSQKQLFLKNVLACVIFAATVITLTAIFSYAPGNSKVIAEPAPVEPEDNAHIENWAFFLINDNSPLPDYYEPELAAIDFDGARDFFLDARCADYAAEMLKAARSDGIILCVVSAYRSRQRQADTFSSYVERLIRENRNITEAEAAAIAAVQIARPGASEHNAGLAVDILSEDWFIYHTDVTEEFERTPEFSWLEKNSWRYGFILRYPRGKEDVTGFIFEPWHFRFVGIDIAEQIYNSELTLEEYIDLYPP